MAARKKNAYQDAYKRRKSRWGRWIALIPAAILLSFFLFILVSARIVRVRYADVTLSDLPTAFEGTTVLYVSDIDVCGINTVSSVNRLFDRLQSLNPDILILGGDYASENLIQRLNGGADLQDVRRTLFQNLTDFSAPMGKYAILGDNDGDAATFAMTLLDTDFAVLDGRITTLEKDGQTLYLVGTGLSGDLSGISQSFTSDQCVIAVSHSPSRVVDIRVSEAKDGGDWTDLILSGHTHGGQIRVAGHSILDLTDTEKRYLAGWYTDAVPLLVTTGLGCEAANLRLGTQGEVWLITLHCST